MISEAYLKILQRGTKKKIFCGMASVGHECKEVEGGFYTFNFSSHTQQITFNTIKPSVSKHAFTSCVHPASPLLMATFVRTLSANGEVCPYLCPGLEGTRFSNNSQLIQWFWHKRRSMVVGRPSLPSKARIGDKDRSGTIDVWGEKQRNKPHQGSQAVWLSCAFALVLVRFFACWFVFSLGAWLLPGPTLH